MYSRALKYYRCFFSYQETEIKEDIHIIVEILLISRKLLHFPQNVVDYTKKNGEIINADARELLGLAESTTKRILGAMVKEGLLLSIGENKARKHVIKQ